MWYTYILECADKTLYTGITTNPNKRLHEHNHSKLGAKYTRIRRPVKLVYTHKSESRSTAAIEESRIKKLTRTEKLALINQSKR